MPALWSTSSCTALFRRLLAHKLYMKAICACWPKGGTLLVCVSRTNTVVAVRLWKKNPNTLAADTRADSSGDSASYSIW